MLPPPGEIGHTMTPLLHGSSGKWRHAGRFGLAVVVAVGLLPILSRLPPQEAEGRTYSPFAAIPVPGPNARPEDKGFSFTARKDGWYWFVVQTQDFDNT